MGGTGNLVYKRPLYLDQDNFRSRDNSQHQANAVSVPITAKEQPPFDKNFQMASIRSQENLVSGIRPFTQ